MFDSISVEIQDRDYGNAKAILVTGPNEALEPLIWAVAQAAFDLGWTPKKPGDREFSAALVREMREEDDG